MNMPSDRATSSARLVLRIVKADRRQGRVNTPRSRARYPRLLHRLAHVVDPLRPCRTSRWSYIGMAEQLLHHGQIVGLVQRAHAGGEAKARALKAAFVQVGSLFERRPPQVLRCRFAFHAPIVPLAAAARVALGLLSANCRWVTARRRRRMGEGSFVSGSKRQASLRTCSTSYPWKLAEQEGHPRWRSSSPRRRGNTILLIQMARQWIESNFRDQACDPPGKPRYKTTAAWFDVVEILISRSNAPSLRKWRLSVDHQRDAENPSSTTPSLFGRRHHDRAATVKPSKKDRRRA